jgi:peroxiredoxin
MVDVGQSAPAFALRDQHGQDQTLAARRGARNVLLVFYPFAFTGVCSGELRALSDSRDRWDGLDTDVLAVSCDPVPSLRAFADAEGYEIPLLSDFWPHGAVATQYAAFDNDRGAAARHTFVIDREGIVRWTVANKIADARNIEEYAAALAALS